MEHSVEKRLRFRIGRQHDRPDSLPMNRELERLGSAWRVTTAKSLGLHIWNQSNGVCLLPDDDGYVGIPDLPNQ